MAGILKRKKRLGRPRKSVKTSRTPKTESKVIKSKTKTTTKKTETRKTTTKKAEATTKKAETTTKKAEATTKKAEATTKKAETTTKKAEATTKKAEATTKKAEATPKKTGTTTKKVAKSKRGPGRPRKNKKTTTQKIEQDDKHKTTILEKQEPPKKRGPGRPPKKQTEKKEEVPKKRGPGRPRKNAAAKTEKTEKTTETPKKRGPGRPRKNKKTTTEDKQEEPKTKETKKQPNPLLEIMDNFKDDKKRNDDDDTSTDDLGDFMSGSMGNADVVMPEDSDIELMSNSDLDVEEIIKIDTTDSEELERELDNLSGISEKEQMKEDVAEMEKQETICPECGSKKLINDHERGEVVCGACGLVIDDNIVDMGPEWRAFDHEQRDKRTRVGAPITYTIHDKGLSTMIDWRNKDIYGRDIPARNRAQWYRLRKWQRKIRISGATERNLAFALSELDRDSSRLGLPRSVRESASVVYRNAVENKLIRGRSIEGVVAASLYAACRRCKVPRTLDEIADVSRVSKKEVGRTYRFLTRELHIRLPPTSPIDYVPRFASELNLSGVVQSKAIEIINQAMDNGLTSGRGPTGVAAAALYIASVLLGERKTQRDVADIAGVTEVTIRNRYKELTEQLDVGVNL